MVTNKKYKKFFRFAAPVLILEILAVIGLVVFLIVMPKDYCRINTNYDNAVIYVNNKKTNKVRLDPPEQQMVYNFYEFDVFLEIEESGTFNVTYKLSCDKYEVLMQTDASDLLVEQNTLTVQGNTQTKLLNTVVVKSNEPIKDYNVYLDVEIIKI